jgi:hypothetical protein
MNWKLFFIRFFRNLVIALVLGVVVMGGFGYLLAGRQGMINMVPWGIALGLIGSFSSGLGLLFAAKFWGEGNYPVLPEWNWFVKPAVTRDKDSDHSEIP